MTLIKICSGKGRFSQSGGSFFQNFPWHENTKYIYKYNITQKIYEIKRRKENVYKITNFLKRI